MMMVVILLGLWLLLMIRNLGLMGISRCTDSRWGCCVNYDGRRTRRNICASTRVGCMLLGARMLRLWHDNVWLLGMWAGSWLEILVHNLVTICC